MTIYKPHLNNLRVGFIEGTPDASSSIQLDDTTTGLGLNALTTTQINAIVSPRTGLFVFNTTTGVLNYYNGSAWVAVEASTGVGLSTSAVSSAVLTATSNTVLAPVTGLTVNLITGATYIWDIYLQGTAGASGGLKVAFGGTATATSFASDSWMYNGATLAAQLQATSFASNLIAANAIYTTAYLTGTMVVNAGGTVTIQAAQNTSNGTSTTVAVLSNMTFVRVS